MSALNLINKVFTRLTVTSRAANHITPTGRQLSAWNCSCSCGNKSIVTGDNLKRGFTKSCGCLAKDNAIISKPLSAIKLKARLAATLKARREAAYEALLVKTKAIGHMLGEDEAAGLCTPLHLCDKYYLYTDGRLFSMRTLKFLKADLDHGEYKGAVKVRRTPIYTVIVDDNGTQARFSIANMLLKVFHRLPVNGEKAWRIDWLRNPCRVSKLNELEWVSKTEHNNRTDILSSLVGLTKDAKRYRIKQIEYEIEQRQTAVTTAHSIRQDSIELARWHNAERGYIQQPF